MRTPWQKHVIAVGGDVGAGNETVLGMLSQLGYCTLDADQIARQLTQKGGAAYQQILDRWGDDFLDSRGQLDRYRLNQAARDEPGLMEAVRSIVYPLVKAELVSLIQGAVPQFTFIKTNNLDAYGLRELCDGIWIVTATEDAQVANLVKDHGWTVPLARQFVRAQPQPDLSKVRADAVLHNTGPRAALWRQLIESLRGLEDVAGQQVTAALPQDSAVLSISPAATPTSAPPVAITSSFTSQRRKEPSAVSLRVLELKLLGREIVNTLLILIALAFLTSWGLLLAEYGRQHLPISGWQALWQALVRTGQFVTAHPSTYYWAHEQTAWFELVSKTLGQSAGLLLLSMGAAVIVGLPLGVLAATVRHRAFSAIVMVLSVLGASTPSFLFAMMLWVVNIAVHRSLNIPVLPSTGFGWDAHLVMPMLVLAMRPLAQVAQVTYVTMSEVLQQDYVRTAYSKGLAWRAIRDRHVLRNMLIPILTTLGTSLRFSLASLPVVEIFFRWPGVGSMLMDAINQGTDALVLDLILSLGLFFLVVNLLIDFCFPLIDPQLRTASITADRTERQTPREALGETWNILSAWYGDLKGLITSPFGRSVRKESTRTRRNDRRVKRRNWLLRNLLRNPILIASSVVLLLLIALALFGSNLTGASPYQVHGVMAIDGEYGAPPFKPSSIFPWGTDHIGRDMQSLVLAGAQRTLSLAFFGMLARLLLGSILGILAGWQRGGRFDRMVTGAMGIWAAYPATLFAMIVIQALGIQQGMWVFVVGICVVGWGEVAQFVRAQVISLKPRLFVESARSVGARTDQILVRHILPNLANPLLVLAALEMGGVLMLLAELGFLNVFMGGGFRTMIGESGSMQPVVAFYSDVPEWGALIANVRAQWRSYPWMALYPGLAVLISILSLNLFGEGLRRFLDDSALNLSRFFNRYTFTAAAGVAIAVALVLQSAVPLSMYRPEGLKFDEQRVLNDIRILSSPKLQGRETGTPGASLAALYIAQRMAEVGIFPAGEHHHYFQRLVQPRLHLASTPAMAVMDDSGKVLKEFVYRQDFAEIARINQSRGEAEARVMGLAYGPILDTESSQPDLRNGPAWNHIVIVRAEDLPKVKSKQVKGILVIADNPDQLLHRDVYPYELARSEDPRPRMLVSASTADLLLRTAGSSLAELDAARSSLTPGDMSLTEEGSPVSMSLQALEAQDPGAEAYINVIGVIPGQGHFMGTEEQVIVVSAYYDGVGTDPSGMVYPGANDNASGVAMMLEMARLLKESSYQPDKTVLFVAWAGGERQELKSSL